MIETLEKIWAWLYLRWNGYCTKHLVKKDVVVYEGGCSSTCPTCEAEENEQRTINTINALDTLRK